MKKSLHKLLPILMVICCINCVFTQNTKTKVKSFTLGTKISAPIILPSKPGWNLIFNDEFDSDVTIGWNKVWNSGYPWGQTIEKELEYYTRYDKNFNTNCDKGGNNHIFNNGTLTLQIKKEPGQYEQWFPTRCENYLYTSGMIHSNQSYLYGYFEIRAKVPLQGTILWPAFWLFNGGNGASEYREIDIFEFSGHTPNMVLTNVHIARQLDNNYHPPGSKENNNNYPAEYELKTAPNVTDAFHTYAVKWTPNSITWFVDDNPIRVLGGHSPHLPMNIIANIAAAWWDPPTGVSFPQNYEIDYIRVYKNLAKEFVFDWGNNGNGKLDLWNINTKDQYTSGDFDGDGKDEILAINSANGWHHTIKFNSGNWKYLEGNGSGKIDLWKMDTNDQYIKGDFDGDHKDEILVLNINKGWHHTMRFTSGRWEYIEGTGGGKIDLWNMNLKDQYIAGDFDGDGKDEILAVNVNTGWYHTIKFISGHWKYSDGKDGKKIDLWNMKTGDQFFGGDFNGDGKDEILAINANTNWHHTIGYVAGKWAFIEGSGDGKINWWKIAPNNKFIVDDFQGNGKKQLLAISPLGSVHLMQYTSAGWTTDWINDDSKTIDLWQMKADDVYISGKFNSALESQLLSVSAINGWSHLIKYSIDY